MSDDEIASLYTEVEEEMIKRDLLKQHLYVGEYMIGDDLPAGRYVLSAFEVYDSRYSGLFIRWQIYEYDNEKQEWVKTHSEDLSGVGQKTSFKLEEGQKLRIEHGEFEVVGFKTK